MLRPALLTFVIFAVGCGKKPDPAPAPDLGWVAVEPPPPAPGPAVQPKKKWPPKPVDANNFAGKSLAQWREDLRSKDRGKVVTAMKAVQALGPQAADAVPDLLTTYYLYGPDDFNNRLETERYVAAHAEAFQEAVKAVGTPAVPHLLAALDAVGGVTDPNDPKLTAASNAMRAAGYLDAADAVPKLEAAAKSTAPGVSAGAVRALIALGPTARPALPTVREALREGLRSSSEETAIEAAAALGKLDPNGTADDALAVLLAVPPRSGTNPHPYDRVTKLLPLFGSKGVAALMASAKKPDTSALVRLWGFKPEHLGPVVPDLVKLLDVVPEAKVWYVLVAIKSARLEGKAALPAVLKLARNPYHRSEAIWTASEVGATPEDLLPIVKDALANVSATGAELYLVHYLGAAGKEVASLVTPFLADPRREVREGAAAVLARRDPTHSDACRVLLELSVPEGRRGIAPGELWALPASAAAGLKPHLSHPDANVRRLAAVQVARRDPANDEAAKLLKASVYSEMPSAFEGQPAWPVVDREAIGAFRKGGAGGAPHLIELLAHAKVGVRSTAATALAELGPLAAPSAAKLAAALATETDDEVRFYLLTTLGRIGAPAKPHTEALTKSLGSPVHAVRFAAAEALLALDPSDAVALAALVELVKPVAPVGPQPRVRPVGTTDKESYFGDRVEDIALDPRAAAVKALYELDPEAAVRAGAFLSLGRPPGKDGPGKGW